MTDIPIITDPAAIPQRGDCVLNDSPMCFRAYRDGLPAWKVIGGDAGLRTAWEAFPSFSLYAQRAHLDCSLETCFFAATAEEAVTQYLAALPLGEIRILPCLPRWRAVGGSTWKCEFGDGALLLLSGFISNREWPQVRAVLDLIHEWQQNPQADGPIARAIREAK